MITGYRRKVAMYKVIHTIKSLKRMYSHRAESIRAVLTELMYCGLALLFVMEIIEFAKIFLR